MLRTCAVSAHLQQRQQLMCMLVGASPPRKGQDDRFICQLSGTLRMKIAIGATPFAVWLHFCRRLSLAWPSCSSAAEAARIVLRAIREAQRLCAREADAHARGTCTGRMLMYLPPE